MTKRRDVLTGLAMAPVVLSSSHLTAGTSTAEQAQFLFVQSARQMRYAKGQLTLVDVSPVTVLFSDRPERLAGHMLTEAFVPFWSEGDDSFEKDPPNADLAVLESNQDADVVLTLHEPRLLGRDLSYRVDVLEGGSRRRPVVQPPCSSTSSAGRSRPCPSPVQIAGCGAGGSCTMSMPVSTGPTSTATTYPAVCSAGRH